MKHLVERLSSFRNTAYVQGSKLFEVIVEVISAAPPQTLRGMVFKESTDVLRLLDPFTDMRQIPRCAETLKVFVCFFVFFAVFFFFL